MALSSLYKLLIIPVFIVILLFVIYVSFQWGKNSCIAESYEVNVKKNNDMSRHMEMYNSINYPKIQEEIDKATNSYRKEYEDYISQNAGVVRNIYADELHDLPSKDVHDNKHTSVDTKSVKAKSS